jgi:hypothetical protein
MAKLLSSTLAALAISLVAVSSSQADACDSRSVGACGVTSSREQEASAYCRGRLELGLRRAHVTPEAAVRAVCLCTFTRLRRDGLSFDRETCAERLREVAKTLGSATPQTGGGGATPQTGGGGATPQTQGGRGGEASGVSSGLPGEAARKPREPRRGGYGLLKRPVLDPLFYVLAGFVAGAVITLAAGLFVSLP